MSVPIAVAIDLALSLLEGAARVSAVVRRAQASGQDQLTDDQWLSITDADDAARERLEQVISKMD